jgi:hypothetical protein
MSRHCVLLDGTLVWSACRAEKGAYAGPIRGPGTLECPWLASEDQDKERLEPPHVTVLFKTRKWRFGLRELDFFDAVPDPRDVPKEIVKQLEANVESYTAGWDRLYPNNPVASRDV